MSPLDFILIALATFRLAFMLVNEAGPLRIFERIRNLTKLGGVLDCWHCASVWTAILMWLLIGTPAAPVVWVLAASGAAVMLGRYTGFDYQR